MNAVLIIAVILVVTLVFVITTAPKGGPAVEYMKKPEKINHYRG